MAGRHVTKTALQAHANEGLIVLTISISRVFAAAY